MVFTLSSIFTCLYFKIIDSHSSFEYPTKLDSLLSVITVHSSEDVVDYFLIFLSVLQDIYQIHFYLLLNYFLAIKLVKSKGKPYVSNSSKASFPGITLSSDFKLFFRLFIFFKPFSKVLKSFFLL